MAANESSKKRKVNSSSESEYEVEKDALNINATDVKKSTVKKGTQTVANVPIDKVSFHLLEFALRWKFIYHMRVAVERELSEETVKIKEVMEQIKEARLMKTVCNLGDCYEKLVKEFVVNIPEDYDNPLSREYQKVYVRGECINFSPNIINRFLGLAEEDFVELEATDNQISMEGTANKVRTWPKKEKISSEKLSVKYVILNRIGAANWIPTTDTLDIATGLAKFIYAVDTRVKMNFGRYIFDQTIRHAKTDAVRLPIAFPSLLCSIILDQHPGLVTKIAILTTLLVTASDLPKKRDSPLTIHQKLFGDNHVPYLVGTFVPTSAIGFVTKEEIITALKDMCVMLDERKAQLKLMIHSLEKGHADNNDDLDEGEKDEDVEGANEDEEEGRSGALVDLKGRVELGMLKGRAELGMLKGRAELDMLKGIAELDMLKGGAFVT
ncbi:uncharacterized protein [Medicago truncatula]|uniref:uncharacterized protein n=1 Tax=Medicago truncatula TaxID=3880 RepID=UPI000D2F3B3C|nr:uncharacterized protein LOC112419786 [Medicago truncatula]